MTSAAPRPCPGLPAAPAWASAIWRSTFAAQPPGWALTQMKPRMRGERTCGFGMPLPAKPAAPPSRTAERSAMGRQARLLHELDVVDGDGSLAAAHGVGVHLPLHGGDLRRIDDQRAGIGAAP